MRPANQSPFGWSRRMSRMKASEVREILKVTERPDILSFAGGLPAPDLFPVEALAQAHAQVFAEAGPQALQYSTTEGYLPLRAWLSGLLASRGLRAPPERVLITNGSQQGIDLACKVLVDPGDAVVVENPSYLAALQVFGGYEASVVAVGSDDAGMRVDELEAVFRARRPKLVYLTPTFQNPKGTSLSLERRQRLVQVCADFHVPIVEDDPYGELRYRGERAPLLAGLAAGAAQVLYLSTFSKTLSPGLRIGWAVGSEELIRAMTIAKQAADLHTSTLVQRSVARLLETFDFEAHVGRIRKVYAERCQAMLEALEQAFPAQARWTRPEGGLFVWCRLPDGVHGEDLLADAIKERVAFVPGAAFFAHSPAHEYIRLNFSNRPPDAIRDGIARLGRVLARRGSLAPAPVATEVAPRSPPAPPGRT